MEALTMQTGKNGRVTKVRFVAHDDNIVEAAFIRRAEKSIVCFPTQMGCLMGCRFCSAGRFQRNLTVHELTTLVSRMTNIALMERINKPVLYSAMGVGEPTHNPYFAELTRLMLENTPSGTESNARLAFSTTMANIKGFQRILTQAHGITDPKRFKVQISLHGIRHHVRHNIFGETAVGLVDLMDAVGMMQRLGFGEDQLELNYTLIEGINDALHYVNDITKYFPGRMIKITPLNKCTNTFFKPSPRVTVDRFVRRLTENGHPVEIYKTDGASIKAACGMMLGGKYV